ncbi:MAG TPA: phosphoribosylglycinamide formyltransferase [Novosphingobium sp.]|nr:phosphoribosylglycinamide formyltransferase [Novosphingobium sp.]
MAERARLAVLISGTGTNMAALIYAGRAGDCPYEVVLVASNDPAAPGLALAAAEGIETFALAHQGVPKDHHEAAIERALRDAGADFVALAGYMRVLSPEFVARWEGRLLNIHPSLLPAHKGLDTHARALAANDARAGCSVHLVTAELDDGPVLGQVEVAVLPGDTPETLAARVLIAEHQLYPRVVADYVRRDRDPDYLIGQVRARALALPETDEVLSHGMPCFGVLKGKKFAYVSNDHHGDGKCALLVKVSGLDEQQQLIEMDDERYYRPAYFGDGWIGIRLDIPGTDWDNIADWLARSWQVSAPKKLSGLMNAVDDF